MRKKIILFTIAILMILGSTYGLYKFYIKPFDSISSKHASTGVMPDTGNMMYQLYFVGLLCLLAGGILLLIYSLVKKRK